MAFWPDAEEVAAREWQHIDAFLVSFPIRSRRQVHGLVDALPPHGVHRDRRSSGLLSNFPPSLPKPMPNTVVSVVTRVVVLPNSDPSPLVSTAWCLPAQHEVG